MLDGLGQLMARHGFGAAAVASVTAHVPPLVHRLVGRPLIAQPEANYAKLCLPYVAGAFLAQGQVDVPQFRAPALTDCGRPCPCGQGAGGAGRQPRPECAGPADDCGAAAQWAEHAAVLTHVYGHPAVPLSAAQNVAKFRRCLSYAPRALPPAQADALIALIDGLEAVAEAGALIPLMVAA